MSAQSLVSRLLVRGDSLSIEHGRLRLEAASGKPVDSWLDIHREQIVAEIIERTGIDTLLYESYSTGNYGKHKAGGITLQFSSLLTDNSPYVIFNAELTRSRNTRKGKAGSLLPQGQFRVGKKSLFYQFWQSTGLAEPPRLSSFHDYMGNLKGCLFTGNVVAGERLDAGSVCPVNINYQQLLAAYDVSGFPDKSRTASKQAPNNCQTKSPYKTTSQGQTPQGIQQDQATGADSYGIRLKGSAGIRGNVIALSTLIKPIEQTTNEWLADYSSSEPINHRFSSDD